MENRFAELCNPQQATVRAAIGDLVVLVIIVAAFKPKGLHWHAQVDRLGSVLFSTK
jgi:hypothetical protein